LSFDQKEKVREDVEKKRERLLTVLRRGGKKKFIPMPEKELFRIRRGKASHSGEKRKERKPETSYNT